METPWRIQLLGGLCAQQGDRVLKRLQTQKPGWLLAYLAYYRDRDHSREALIELLWPEREPQAGRHSLSMALSSLRHQLEPPGTVPATVIMADRASVRLNPIAVTTDVAEFDSALQSAARAGSSTERMQLLSRAVELYRGALLPDGYDDWILLERERLAETHLQALIELASQLERAGSPARALDYVRRATAADPCREETHRELMRLLAASGQPSAALQQYQALERILREELGQAPSAATRQLADEIERSGSDVQVAGRAGVPAEPSTEDLSPDTPPPGHERPNPPTPEPLNAPTGTVTFLLTDIEGHTVLWERVGEAFKTALTAHHTLLRQEFREHRGYEVKEGGDSFLVAFARAGDALACAVAAQQALAAHRWPEEVGVLRVRMALHTGDVEPEEGDYHDLVLNHAARMVVAAHGGQILSSEVTAGLLRWGALSTREPDVSLSDLGVFRLRDVGTPERLFQVDYPGMVPRSFPPLRAESAHTSSLPLQFDRFFGREEEIARLLQFLLPAASHEARLAGHESRIDAQQAGDARDTSREARLVTLTGPGGSGKTRLALEVAGQLAEPFHGAVWFVSLADLSDPDLIADTTLVALRLPRSPDLAPLEQVVEALSRQPALLVLDNFEHLATGGAAIVRTLLEQVPTLTCVVTSRQRLNLSGEREFPVLPLPTPHGPDTPERLTLYDSVRLFIDRAQTVRPDFQVTNSNAAAVAELCDRLEGSPLAIELAAARAQVLTPARMLDHLEHRLDFLVSRQRDTASRHRTLRAAIDWSYQLLSPELRQFFARLSVFRGGGTPEAAEAVCLGESPGHGSWGLEDPPTDAVMADRRAQDRGPNAPRPTPDVLDLLAELRECSLVMIEEVGDELRFRLQETLREYAWSKLQAGGAEGASWGPVPGGEADRLRDRFRDWYLALVEQAEPELVGPDQTLWLERLEVEHDNLRAALGWSMENGQAEAGLRLGAALWRFWFVRGYLAEGRERLARLLALAGDAKRQAAEVSDAVHDRSFASGAERPASGLAAARAKALNGAGILAYSQGDYPAAQTLLEESLTLWRELGDAQGIGSVLNNLGTVAEQQGNYRTARARYQEGLETRRNLGDSPVSIASLEVPRRVVHRRGIAFSLSGLGSVAVAQGEFAAARTLLEESLGILRAIGDKQSICNSLNSLGSVALCQGDLAAPHALYEESLALSRELGNRQTMALALHNLGLLEQRQGNHLQARALHLQSLLLRREVGHKRGIAESLEGLAAASTHAPDGGRADTWGPLHQAARLFGAAQTLREAIGAPRSPSDGADYDQSIQAARAGLGEKTFAREWTEGQSTSLEQVIADALRGTPDG